VAFVTALDQHRADLFLEKLEIIASRCRAAPQCHQQAEGSSPG
jgi:hypothetical protein